MRTALVRACLFALCVLVVSVLFGWYGALDPAPADNNYPREDRWADTPDRYVGDQVGVSGIVVSTDPIVIEVMYGVDSRTEITVTGTDANPAVGQEFTAFGALVDTNTIEAERTTHRSLWEKRYMYAVSLLGGIWILSRFLRQWRFDRARLGFTPRGENDE
jgi:hypothetical protein